MSIELEYINRKKRHAIKYLELGILPPLALFFYAAAYAGEYDETLAEQWFDFPEYWRGIGWIGLAITVLVYSTLGPVLLSKNGKVCLSEEKIELIRSGENQTFETSKITDLIFTKDLPQEDDERNESRKASRLTFNYQGRKVDLELRILDKSESDQLHPISKYWRANVKGYREKYR